MYIKLKKHAHLILGIFVLLSACSVLVGKANAATDPVSLTLNWDNNCSDAPTISSTPSNLYYLSGDSVNLNITNQSSQVLDVTINQSGGPLSANGGNENVSRTLSDTLTIRIDPDSSQTSCGYKDNPGYTYIYGASTVSALSCSISNNQVWSISANYNTVAPTDNLYRGNTYVGTYNTTKGGVGSGDFDTTLQFSAQTSPQTYYLYDGTSSSDTLLGQTTCPAEQAVSHATNSTSTTNQTPHSSPATTPTTTSPPAAAATTSNNNGNKPVTPVTAPTSQKQVIKTKNNKSNLARYVIYSISGVLLVIIAAGLILRPTRALIITDFKKAMDTIKRLLKKLPKLKK